MPSHIFRNEFYRVGTIVKGAVGVKYTDEELEIAKSTDLVELARECGYTPVPKGAAHRYHTLKEDTYVMIKDRKIWYQNADNTSGDSIGFLIKFCGLDFQTAVLSLLEKAGYQKENNGFINDELEMRFRKNREKIANGKPDQETKGEFILPPENDDFRRLYAYLIKERCLSKVIVDWFVKKGLIYEEKKYHNIVFIGIDDTNGTAKFASMRGTHDYWGYSFKGDVKNNDKTYCFHVLNKNSAEVKVFEAAIDLMSYMDLKRDFKSNKLALGMLDDQPLERFLEENPHVKSITVMVDNDVHGRKAAVKIRKKYKEAGYKVKVRFPDKEKDWNDYKKYLFTQRQKNNVYAKNHTQAVSSSMALNDNKIRRI